MPSSLSGKSTFRRGSVTVATNDWKRAPCEIFPTAAKNWRRTHSECGIIHRERSSKPVVGSTVDVKTMGQMAHRRTEITIRPGNGVFDIDVMATVASEILTCCKRCSRKLGPDIKARGAETAPPRPARTEHPPHAHETPWFRPPPADAAHPSSHCASVR